MKEINRIIQLYKDLYSGSPWLDVSIMETLKNVNASTASFRISKNRNSIWEIVNHMILWRENVLKRLEGKTPITPDTNYFEAVPDQSPQAWLQTIGRLEQSQQNWLHFLKDFDENDFDKLSTVTTTTHHKHIHGILQHDAYHLGQLSLMIKLCEEKSI